MPATTRHATGNSRPRQFTAVSTEPTTKRAPAAKRKTPAAKSASAKTTAAKTPRSKTAGGRVTKAKAPAASHKRKPSTGDKVKGAAKKAAGAVERKPGKKGAWLCFLFAVLFLFFSRKWAGLWLHLAPSSRVSSVVFLLLFVLFLPVLCFAKLHATSQYHVDVALLTRSS